MCRTRPRDRQNAPLRLCSQATRHWAGATCRSTHMDVSTIRYSSAVETTSLSFLFLATSAPKMTWGAGGVVLRTNDSRAATLVPRIRLRNAALKPEFGICNDIFYASHKVRRHKKWAWGSVPKALAEPGPARPKRLQRYFPLRLSWACLPIPSTREFWHNRIEKQSQQFCNTQQYHHH